MPRSQNLHFQHWCRIFLGFKLAAYNISGTINGPCFRDRLVPDVLHDCFATYLIIQGLASNSKAPPYFKDISVFVVNNNGVVTPDSTTTLTLNVPLAIADTIITRSAVTAPYNGVFTVESINFSEATNPNMNVCLLLTASDNQHGALIPYTVAREP
ncbi:unnamed protein product [Gordionus sp. m RMFG-2023]